MRKKGICVGDLSEFVVLWGLFRTSWFYNWIYLLWSLCLIYSYYGFYFLFSSFVFLCEVFFLPQLVSAPPSCHARSPAPHPLLATAAATVQMFSLFLHLPHQCIISFNGFSPGNFPQMNILLPHHPFGLWFCLNIFELLESDCILGPVLLQQWQNLE